MTLVQWFLSLVVVWMAAMLALFGWLLELKAVQDFRKPRNSQWLPGAAASALMLGGLGLDVLGLSGVLGPGWPLTPRAFLESALLSVGAFSLAVFVLSVFSEFDEGRMPVALWAAGAVVPGVWLGLLLAGVVWQRGGGIVPSVQSGAGPGAVTSSPVAGGHPGISGSGDGALLAWTVVGAIGGISGAVAAWVAVFRRD
jgi:hypothetical protein